MFEKIIAIDVDGTLLNDDHEITPLTMDVLHKAQKRGCCIMLASGRGPQNGLPVMDQLGIEGWMITHNGAVTVDSKTKEVISRFPFSIEQVWPVIEYARANGIHFDICDDFDHFVEGASDMASGMYQQFGIQPIFVPTLDGWQDPIVKFTLCGKAEQLDRAMEEFGHRFPGVNVIRSGIQFIDIFHGQASKGNALRDVCEKYGILREEVISFGNYFNDVDMIQFAGLGVAMDNSPDGVKAAADRVAPSNNDDGVAKVLIEVLGL
jgi:Cof subfamily protein (haloacid dehalogenase superfamily)